MMYAYTIGTTEDRIAKKNPDRTSMIIHCNNATAVLYFRDSKGVSTSNGLPIRPRGYIALSVDQGDDPTLEFWAISDTANTDVRVYEGFKPARRRG